MGEKEGELRRDKYVRMAAHRGLKTGSILLVFFSCGNNLAISSLRLWICDLSQVTALVVPAARRSPAPGSIALAHVSRLYSNSQTTPPLPPKHPFRELSVDGGFVI